QTRRYRCCGSSAGATWNARRVPGIVGRAIRGVLRGRAPRELVLVLLPEQLYACGLAPIGDGRVEHGNVALEDPRARCRAHAFRRDHVLERDRDTVVVVAVDERQETVELLVSRVDRLAVGRAQ